jgi:Icc-related predicted phosphoesterase
MNVLFVADLHYALKQFDWLVAQAPRYDAVIIGGDLLDLSGALEIDVQIVVIEKYLHRLRELTRLIVSSGNHDGDSRNTADESVAHWLLEAKMPGLFADGDSIELGDHLVTVCAWWDGPMSRAELEAQLAADAARPKRRWVWVHHAPPDRSPVSWTGKRDSGDEFLRGWIERFQPDLVLSGHIHNAPFYPGGSWIDRIGQTWVFNPGRQLGPEPTCVAFDLEKMTAEWIAIEGRETRALSEPSATAGPSGPGAA